MSRLTAACLMALLAVPALAEGPQEQALDRSLAATGGQPSSQQQPPVSAAQTADPSQVVSRPTQTEPAHEGPEEKALDRSLKSPAVPDGDTE